MSNRVMDWLSWPGEQWTALQAWVEGTDTWQRMAGFSFDTWHSLVSSFFWGLTFTVLCLVPLKRTREWTPLAAGLTIISGILAVLLMTTVANAIWPTFQLGVARPLFRDVGMIVNIVIIIKVFFPGGEDDNDDDDPPGGLKHTKSEQTGMIDS